MEKIKSVTKQQLERYPRYLTYLQKLKNEGVEKVSAKVLSDIVNCTEDQVRKDFQAINMEKGKPNSGRDIQAYIDCIEDFLGYRNSKDVVIVGIGHLGTALMNFDGFHKHGFNILAGFDNDPAIIGTEVNGHKIFPIEKMENLIPRLKVRIAIVTLPPEATQPVIDQLVKCGIRAIWNFAPVHVDVPDDVIVENADLAASLSLMTLKLEERDRQKSSAAETYKETSNGN